MWIRSNTFVLGPIFFDWDYSIVFCFHVSVMPDRETSSLFSYSNIKDRIRSESLCGDSTLLDTERDQPTQHPFRLRFFQRVSWCHNSQCNIVSAHSCSFLISVLFGEKYVSHSWLGKASKLLFISNIRTS